MIYNEQLPRSKMFKYLGIWFNCRGIDERRYFEHAKGKICARIADLKSSGFDMRNLPSSVLIRIFKAFCGPILEFGVGIHPFASQLKAYEREHAKGLAWLLGLDKGVMKDRLYAFTGVVPMALRREILGFKQQLRAIEGPSEALLSKTMKQNLISRTASAFSITGTSELWTKYLEAVEGSERSIMKEKNKMAMDYTRSAMKEKKEKFPSLDYGEDMHAAQVMDRVCEQPYRKVAAIWIFNKIPMAGKYCPDHLGMRISKAHIQEYHTFSLSIVKDTIDKPLDQHIEETLRLNDSAFSEDFQIGSIKYSTLL